ncbi:hypothetical protein LSTR_LSTR001578 [Laodelphax striatellus]|uniref:Uncharacterized protein n=1 Tax=Laodelphax striatellus TaxID=195883 RepID=A0A482XCA2_LAOST|nr:hypothetical protein LSTR_LSTR001578 [Laodelphax striatellus]
MIFWSFWVAVAIIAGIIYLMTNPDFSASLATKEKNSDDELDDDDDTLLEGEDALPISEDADCDKAWKKRMKVCNSISRSRKRICESRRRIANAQKELHVLRESVRKARLQTVTVMANLKNDLIRQIKSNQDLNKSKECIDETKSEKEDSQSKIMKSEKVDSPPKMGCCSCKEN